MDWGESMTKQISNYRIADLASSDRPRERLAEIGAEALSDAELLAILLRSGIEGLNVIQMAQKILVDHGGLVGLHRAPYEELTRVHGVGPAKAAQLKAAIELGRRLSIADVGERPTIQCPEDAAALVGYEMGALEQEHLRVILLDTRNNVIKIVEIYKGSLNASSVRIGEIFRDAIRMNAASIILIHNHPSGDPTPSPEDVSVTKAIITAGELMGIEVLDHLIIGKNAFISMKAKGMGFT
jgi:DNA repair protein RadC